MNTCNQRRLAVSRSLPIHSNSGGSVLRQGLSPGFGAFATDLFRSLKALAIAALLLAAANLAQAQNAGNVTIANLGVGDAWEYGPINGAPAARFWHSAVWTGQEMIIWGGAIQVPDPTGENRWLNAYANDGGRYDPALRQWTQISTNGAPTARIDHTAVWTGTEMIVWGGLTGEGDAVYWDPTQHALNDGARYNPATDTWTAMSTQGAPSPRPGQVALWTGTEMIIWGEAWTNSLLDGARYNPATDTWTPISPQDAPAAYSPQGVWTGREMILWGLDSSAAVGLGARYNPATDQWIAISSLGGPGARTGYTTVWTGQEVVVWGNYSDAWKAADISLAKTGERYDPDTDSWAPITTLNAPSARGGQVAIWTGHEMIIWGGEGPAYGSIPTLLDDGRRYNPSSDSWTAMATGDGWFLLGSTTVWTGNQMINWGGGAPAGDLMPYQSQGMLIYTPAAPIVRLAWPLSAANWSLERTTNLAPPTGPIPWQPVFGPSQTNATECFTLLPVSGAAASFRLTHPQ